MDCFRSLRGVGMVLMLGLVSQTGQRHEPEHRKPHSASTAVAPAKPKPALASKSLRPTDPPLTFARSAIRVPTQGSSIPNRAPSSPPIIAAPL